MHRFIRACLYGLTALLITALLPFNPTTAQSVLEQRIQALEDRLQAIPFPKDAIIFTQGTKCPDGFIELVAMRGRYVVGLPAGGESGAQVGSPLANKERRNVVAYHSHTIQPSELQHTHSLNASKLGYAPDQNGAADGAHLPIADIPNTGGAAYHKGQPGNQITTDATGLPTTNDAAINAPYIQLLGCVHG
jgi:hypothetical protein